MDVGRERDLTLVPTLSVDDTSTASFMPASDAIENIPPNDPNPPTTSFVKVELTISPIRPFTLFQTATSTPHRHISSVVS